MGLFFPEAFKPLSCEIHEKEANNNASNNYNNYYNNYTDAEDLYDDAYLLEGAAGSRAPRPEIDQEGLDVVVASSIGSLGTNMADKSELKRKLYASILLTGGAARLPGLDSILEDRLFERLPPALEVERVEVVPSGGLESRARLAAGAGVGGAGGAGGAGGGGGGGGGGSVGYRDPGLRGDLLGWRGGAIIANVESAKDMWVRQEEWAREGVALLRERLCFGPL